MYKPLALNFRHSPTPFGCFFVFISLLVRSMLFFADIFLSSASSLLAFLMPSSFAKDYLFAIYLFLSIHTLHGTLHACIQTIVKCAQHRCERYVSVCCLSVCHVPVAGDAVSFITQGTLPSDYQCSVFMLESAHRMHMMVCGSKWGERVSHLFAPHSLSLCLCVCMHVCE